MHRHDMHAYLYTRRSCRPATSGVLPHTPTVVQPLFSWVCSHLWAAGSSGGNVGGGCACIVLRTQEAGLDAGRQAAHCAHWKQNMASVASAGCAAKERRLLWPPVNGVLAGGLARLAAAAGTRGAAAASCLDEQEMPRRAPAATHPPPTRPPQSRERLLVQAAAAAVIAAGLLSSPWMSRDGAMMLGSGCR